MTILILEDEPLVAKNLEKLIHQLLPEAVLEGPLVSVEAALNRLRKHPVPDLIMADIQLADGVSFDIFQELKLSCPIIFTTAYDEYAIRAFKVNSIDYLLKPIDKAELSCAFEKFKRWQNTPDKEVFSLQLRDLLHDLEHKAVKQYKRRFTAHFQRAVVAVPDTRVAYFVREEVIWLVTTENQRLITDYQSLDELEELLDPAQFIRANRQYIVRKEALESYRTHYSGKIELSLSVSVKEGIIISKDKAAHFRVWFEL
ncbi:LytR/AlgR family response regulator transcription factor [Runella slithyformis]|uniref:Two component transcriptional regulator, LytTR family n=1 Tax=Runella slithyformis (strain ATCC 29530 / DSM 19594 / LMG 11500 / NCIMB 11436 / LSU 4) TaxID=761193 RepID=A0A7U3ZJY5_RUNSL|nr:LytTR family DNA-binding domain-containing protein [Runella slithyformis]AEI48617.1 two component transcriptional regulator, LytTR family [Runella slithyformis DSM 19594]